MENEKFEQELKDIMRSAAPKGTQEAGHKEHRVSIRGNGNYVANGPIIFAQPKEALPELPAESSRACPQCGDLNWITKRHCKTCDLDLYAQAAFHSHSRMITHLWYSAAGTGVLGLVALFMISPLLSKFGLDTASTLSSLAGVGCGALLLVTLKKIERHSIARRRL
ncbi:MAG: hypothetical protein Q7K57_49330 [Burkholderiaceae bacterium]|nr:hypothetical protein [Burkholderiaceae bacterium]